MKDYLKNKCDLFADNYTELHHKHKWNCAINTRLGALLYTMQGKRVDCEAIKYCQRMIKDNTGIFSQFKDTTTNLMTATMLSLNTDPEMLLKNALAIYDDMKKEGFHSSPYLVLAALFIAMQVEAYQYPSIIKKSKEIYDEMKKKHWFITSSEDYGYAALLAMSYLSVSQVINEMERCYVNLKEYFYNSNAVQSLSHVLTLSEESSTLKCKKVFELYEALKNRGCKFGNGNELPFLGVLSMLDGNSGKLADDIAEVNEYLKGKKGLGSWSVANKERIMFSIALVCEESLESNQLNTMKMSLTNNIAVIQMAQQMAMIAAASASVAAAAAASQ